jgi:uncharacterized protein DUF4385
VECAKKKRVRSPPGNSFATWAGFLLYSSSVSYPYSGVDLRKHPEVYEIGRGEQGVFHADPYKGELLPLWSFKDAKAAKKSADDIYERFFDYKAEGDFVGMDVARKYLQMGYTRSRRYAKYKGGNKSKPLEKPDPEKSRAAEIFYKKWRKAAEDDEYLKLREEHRRQNR